MIMKKFIGLVSALILSASACAEPQSTEPSTSTSQEALTIDDGGITFTNTDPLSQDAGVFSLSVPTEMHGNVSFGDNVATLGALRFSQSPNAASVLMSTRSLNAGNPSTNVITTLSTPWNPSDPDAGYNETVELGDARTDNAILVARNIVLVHQPSGATVWQWSHLGAVASLSALGTAGDVTAYWQFGGGALSGHAGELRWTGGGQHLVEARPSIADGETSLLLRRNVSGSYSMERVSMGSADSCGTGYRCLRVQN